MPPVRDRVISWSNPPRRRTPSGREKVMAFVVRPIRRFSKGLADFFHSPDLSPRKGANPIPPKDKREFDRLSTATGVATPDPNVKPTFSDWVVGFFRALLENFTVS
jgi:hypothetical protein